MKAAVLHGKFDLRIEDIPRPEPSAGEVLLRVRSVGVCGSDVHYFVDGRIGSQVVDAPQTVGHEFMGVVEALGPGVSGIEPGTRVAVDPNMNCGSCRWCRAGRPNCCPNVRFYGTPPVPGAFQEYVVHPADLCFPVPDSMTDDDAALLEPLGIGMHAVDIAPVRLGDTVAVFGSGPIGLVTAAAARAAGAAKVYMTDVLPYRCEFAKALIADDTANPNNTDVVEWLTDLTGDGPDAVYECAGQDSCIHEAVNSVRIGGRCCIVGIPTADVSSFPGHVARRKELALAHVRRACFVVREGLAIMEAGLVRISDMVTHSFDLDDVEKALSLVHNYEDGVIKAMIHV
ncbi:MAG: NAD(P)-dependent alcohol dehydrogenase [Planctomycetes bacterium]|nr:NAD(P)-dependent alcohol dehydrogenase [Planctomycetota bacterium]